MTENHYVKLDQYTLSCAVSHLGHRYWAPFGGPIVMVPPGEEDQNCEVLIRDTITLISRAAAEQVLIDAGMIRPGVDDPETPVVPWVRLLDEAA